LNVVAGLMISFPIVVTQTQSRVITSIVVTIISMIGLVKCYEVNKSGDGNDVLSRFICLGLPIGVRICVIAFCWGVGSTFIEHEEGLIRLGGEVFIEILYFYWLYKHIRNVAFARNSKEEGRVKVFDHFYRRRNQAVWDLVLTDLRFCEDFLGTDYQMIFPEDGYLDLELRTKFIGKSRKVSVNNRSDKTLHNATMVVCLRLTDMYPDDYITMVPGKTVPIVPPGEEVYFGELSISEKIFDQIKTGDDIVAYRAIIICEEGVFWVDSQEFKYTEYRKMKESLTPKQIKEKLNLPWLEDVSSEAGQSILGKLRNSKILEKIKIGKDGLLIKLPRELAVLKPAFELVFDKKSYKPSSNVIKDDVIELVFDSIGDLEGEKQNNIKLMIKNLFKKIEFEWEETKATGSDKKDLKIKGLVFGEEKVK